MLTLILEELLDLSQAKLQIHNHKQRTSWYAYRSIAVATPNQFQPFLDVVDAHNIKDFDSEFYSVGRFLAMSSREGMRKRGCVCCNAPYLAAARPRG